MANINVYEYSDKGELLINSANLCPVVNAELIKVLTEENSRAFAVEKGTELHDRIKELQFRQIEMWKLQDELRDKALLLWLEATNEEE